MTTNASNRYNYSCCFNQYLEPKSNACTECPVGSFGLNCRQRCPPRYYGRLCLSVCECPDSVCNNVTGCVTENSASFPFISTVISSQTTKIAERTRITGDIQTKITSRPFPAKQHDQNKNVSHHDDTWIAVSSSLIGSLVTLILIGCVLYFRSRKKLKLKFPKRIQRILFSRTDEERNIHLLQEDHHPPSTVTTFSRCQDDDTYMEIRCSQISGACSATCLDTINKKKKEHMASKELRNVSRTTNLYGKCSFENEYDHVKLRVKSSIPELSHLKFGIGKDLDYVLLSEKSRFQKQSSFHDESSKSLTLPSSCKTVKQKLQQHSYSLCHAKSENELEDERIPNEKEKKSIKSNSDISVTTKDPGFKEGSRPYSLAHSLSHNDLSLDDEGKLGSDPFSSVTPEVKKDLERKNPENLINSRYSFVEKLVD
ncbi:uncharacterized protein LOC134239868 [Saccostrea cucullata]|uniref:uncharacterized protein LOC134239868 n=1 Tax=Saccostrea cuccullata TaxID=36930 RepID=UPI002ED67E76